MGYRGKIWPVHPHKSKMAGLPVFPSVAALPESPDEVFALANAGQLLELEINPLLLCGKADNNRESTHTGMPWMEIMGLVDSPVCRSCVD